MTSAERARAHARLTPPDEALEIILRALGDRQVSTRLTRVHDAFRFVSAFDVHSQPSKEVGLRSTVDGYATRSENFEGTAGRRLSLVRQDHRVAAIQNGQVVRVVPGSRLPSGANAVIRRNDVVEGAGETISCAMPVLPEENTVPDQNDFARGHLLLRRGKRIGPAELGALVEHGITWIPIVDSPRVAVFGFFERLEPSVAVSTSHLNTEASATSIAAALSWIGAAPTRFNLTDADASTLSFALLSATREYDCVVIAGTPPVDLRYFFSKVNRCDVIVKGLRSNPGRSTILAVIEQRPVIVLQGNTNANLAVFLNVLTPMFERLFHLTSPSHISQGVVGRQMFGKSGWTYFAPIKFGIGKDMHRIFPLPGIGLRSEAWTRMDGFVRINVDRYTLEPGEVVSVVNVPR